MYNIIYDEIEQAQKSKVMLQWPLEAQVFIISHKYDGQMSLTEQTTYWPFCYYY